MAFQDFGVAFSWNFPAKGHSSPRTTKFLSLDKCLPHRDFLQVLEIAERPGSSEQLEYDPEWLAIMKATDNLQKVSPNTWLPPEDNGLHAKWDFTVSEADMMEVVNDLGGDLCIPENFSLTVPSYDPVHPQPNTRPSYQVNPQTTEFCATFGLTDIYAKAGQSIQFRQSPWREDEENSGSCEEFLPNPADPSELSSSYNPDEITIEDEWDEDKGEDEGITGENVTDEMLPERAAGVEEIDREYSSMLSGSHTELVLPSQLSTKDEGVVQSQGSLSLQLPPPTQSTCDSQSLPHEDLEGKWDVQPPKVHKRFSDEEDKGKNIPNKIKRRNQAIYIANEDQED